MSDHEQEKDGNMLIQQDDSSEKKGALLEKPKMPKKSKKYFKANHKKMSPMVQDFMTQVNSMVIGQEDAKNAVALALASTLYFNPSRKKPIATLFFPGPTGVGKTELARAMFRVMYGDKNIDFNEGRIDCSTFTDKHTNSRVMGSEKGYVGYGSKPLFHPEKLLKHTIDAMKANRLHSLFANLVKNDKKHLPMMIVLDEFEKADPEFFKLFYGIFDSGTLTLSDGTIVDFRNTIFIITSNIGSADIQAKLEGKGTVGLIKEEVSVEKVFDTVYYKNHIKSTGLFTAEFINRIKIVPFIPLTKKDFKKRLNMSIFNHNELFMTTGVRIFLTKKVKSFIIDTAFDSNEGGRKLIKIFDDEIVPIFSRLLFNGEIEKREKKVGLKVVEIKIVLNDGKFETKFGISPNQKALDKEEKYKKRLDEKRESLDEQETIISLKENSMLITQRDVMLPNLKYYSKLLSLRDKLDENFEKEIVATENLLMTFGYQKKDFDLLRSMILEGKYNSYEESYNDLHLESSAVRLWNEDDKVFAFNGMLRFIEKYMRKYFEDNKDVKAMIKGGAGTKQDIIKPIIDYATTLIDRELKDNEIGIILAVLHREYTKLNATMPLDKQLPYKKEGSIKTTKNKKESKEKTTEQKSVIININFGADGNQTKPKDKLKNLFQEDFEFVMLSIRQNISDSKESEDIIDIMNNIKIELEKQLDLDSTKTTSIMQVVQDILKGDDILK